MLFNFKISTLQNDMKLVIRNKSNLGTQPNDELHIILKCRNFEIGEHSSFFLI